MNTGRSRDVRYSPAPAPCSPGSGTAEVIVSSRNWFRGLSNPDGNIWRFTTATIYGPRLEFRFLSGLNSNVEELQSFKWNDASSGTFIGQASSINVIYAPFTRLDG